MPSFAPVSDLPVSDLPAELITVTVETTVRYASQEFVTRLADSPSQTYIAGRVRGGLRIERRIAQGEDGQFGSLIEMLFGEIELNNEDGALDPLVNDYTADGRPIRLRLGFTEIDAPGRYMPRHVQSQASVSSGNAAVPFAVSYPDDGVMPGDLFILPIGINDRGSAGDLDGAPPAPWAVIAESSNNQAYQAILHHFAVGDEAGTSVNIEWQSGDAANDVIIGRIYQFRYVDQDDPIGGLTSQINGDLVSINLPAVVTDMRGCLALAVVSATDNASYGSPTGETSDGADWSYIGATVASETGDDVSFNFLQATMFEAGTISGGAIGLNPADSPPSTESIMRGFFLRGLPFIGGHERVRAYSTFDLVYEAVAGGWSFRQDTVRLQVRTSTSRLQNRIQSDVYTGNDGKTGTADMTGRSRPLAFGHCLQILAQLVDPDILTFQLHSGQMQQIIAVYDAGDPDTRRSNPTWHPMKDWRRSL